MLVLSEKLGCVELRDRISESVFCYILLPFEFSFSRFLLEKYPFMLCVLRKKFWNHSVYDNRHTFAQGPGMGCFGISRDVVVPRNPQCSNLCDQSSLLPYGYRVLYTKG